MSGSFNVYSATQQSYARVIGHGGWADIQNWLAYAIVVSNTTATEITTGTIVLECAHADPDNRCLPGPWAPLDAVPTCMDAPWLPGGQAEIVITPEQPIMPFRECNFAAPCPCQFIRANPASVPAGLDVIFAGQRPRRTGGPLIPVQQLNPCLPGYASP